MSDFLTIDEGGEARVDLLKAKRANRLHLLRRVRLGERSVEVDLRRAGGADPDRTALPPVRGSRTDGEGGHAPSKISRRGA